MESGQGSYTVLRSKSTVVSLATQDWGEGFLNKFTIYILANLLSLIRKFNKSLNSGIFTVVPFSTLRITKV